MARSLKAQVEAARKAEDKAYWAVADAYPSMGHVPFGTILEQATDVLRTAFQAAQRRLDAVEDEAVAKCKAWRGSFGMLSWYR